MNRITQSFLMILIGGTLVLPPGWCCVDWTRLLGQAFAADATPVAPRSTCSACCKASKSLTPEEGSHRDSCPSRDSDRCSCQDRNATRSDASEVGVSDGEHMCAVLPWQPFRIATAIAYPPLAPRNSAVAIHIVKCVWQI